MSRLLKKDILDIFLPVQMDSASASLEESGAGRLWRLFEPELAQMNQSTRKQASQFLDKLLGRGLAESLMTLQQSKKIITTKEVAVLIGKSEGSVRNLVCDGRLKPISKKWNTNYFDKDEIIKAILAGGGGS